MVLSTTLAGIRLLVILKILGTHVTAFRSIGVTFIGHLSANVALGPLFSEVVRLTYLFGNSKRGLSHALSALLIDKLLGMAGLLMVITGIIVIFTEKATLASPNNTELLSLMIGVFLSIIIVIFFSPAIMSKLSIFLQKFGKVKWSQQAQELSAALRNFQTLPTKTFFRIFINDSNSYGFYGSERIFLPSDFQLSRKSGGLCYRDSLSATI